MTDEKCGLPLASGPFLLVAEPRQRGLGEQRGQYRLRAKITESIFLRILLAMVLTLMCVPLRFGQVAHNRSSGTNAPLEEPPETAVLGREFKIKYGQQLTVDGQNLKVKFDSLLDDSRYPKDVKCVWQGDARILISVRRAHAAESKMELHTSPNFKQTGKANVT